MDAREFSKLYRQRISELASKGIRPTADTRKWLKKQMAKQHGYKLERKRVSEKRRIELAKSKLWDGRSRPRPWY